MKPIILDFETYYTDEKDERGRPYTLTHLSTEDYVRHPWFEAHGAAIKVPPAPAVWFDQAALPAVLASIDWSDAFLIAWHCQFDGLILSHHYNIIPKMYCCPMSMARLVHGTHVSVSLDNLRKLHHIPPKTTPYNLFKGKRWVEMDANTQRLVGAGACDEVESIWKIFVELMSGDSQFPLEEIEIVDSIIRMFTQPVLRADLPLLAEIYEREAIAKERRFQELKISEDEVQSAAKFAELLEAEGVEIEYKPGKNGDIPAFAKTDSFMEELLDDPDPRIRALTEARLGAKATLMQTRAETLGWSGSRGALPVYLHYCGAATLRPSGGDKNNWLNFKRNSDLRKAILAPPGYLLAPIDASQIEFRVGMYLAGEEGELNTLRSGGDPYVDLPSQYYGEPIYKPEKDDPRKAELEAKRGLGKQGKLMCNYGAGAKRFRATARAGLYGPPVLISDEEAYRFVSLYRRTHPKLCAPDTGYWAQCERALTALAYGKASAYFGPFELKEGRLFLPSGQWMDYTTLEWCADWDWDSWRVQLKSKRTQRWKRIWGSKLFQNICEAVSRVIVSQAMIRIKRELDLRTLNWPYDELLLLIPDDGEAEKKLAAAKAHMRIAPSWLPGLPLDCEGELAERYAK